MRLSSFKRALFAFALSVHVGGCMLPKSSGGDAGADASASSKDAAAADAETDAGLAWSKCSNEPQTGLPLCGAIAACPGVEIDRDRFPDCGFREAPGIVPVCVCSGYVCPLGAPTTCSEAQALIANQTELQICAQAGDGRCTATSGAAPGGSGSCNQECMANCGYTAGCAQLCGC